MVSGTFLMKSFLAVLFIFILIPPVSAGKYNSQYEARKACDDWKKKGGTYKVVWKYLEDGYIEHPTRSCFDELSTRQFIGFQQKKLKRNRNYSKYESLDLFDDRPVKYFKY